MVQEIVTTRQLKPDHGPAEAVAEAMIGTATNSGLRRKARIARDEHQARAMSPARALRLALEKTADKDLSLALSAASTDVAKVDHPGLIGLIPDNVMLILLDGPDGGTGVVAIDAPVLASLIEVQTMGQVLARPVPDRPLTRTDAALAAPLVDGMLARASRLLADHPDRHWACGYRFGAMIEDRRSLGLTLTAPDYHLFRLSLDIGPGTRAGEMLLALPLRPDPVKAAKDASQADPSRQLQARVLDAPVRLDAVLCRLSLPLSDIGALAVGDVLNLPADALREISIEGGGVRRLASASLGKLDGVRALRLHFPAQGLDRPDRDAPDAQADWEQDDLRAHTSEPAPPVPSALPLAAASGTSPDLAADLSGFDPDAMPDFHHEAGDVAPFDDEGFGNFAGLQLDGGPAAA